MAFPCDGTGGYELTAATDTPDGADRVVCVSYRAPRGLPREDHDDGGPSGPPRQVLLLDVYAPPGAGKGRRDAA